MNKSAAPLVLAIAVGVAGCTVVKTPTPTGGSRADGIVELSYEYGQFEKPQVQWGDANRAARQRCEAWGYTDADRFGGVTRQCQAADAYGSCTRWLVTASYQCTGGDN